MRRHLPVLFAALALVLGACATEPEPVALSGQPLVRQANARPPAPGLRVGIALAENHYRVHPVTTTTVAQRPARRAVVARSAAAPPAMPTDLYAAFVALAQCESGGNWQANTGNGFYGGLQFMLDTWRRAGGLAYAPRPDLATKDQQIAVAIDWLHRTSWAQWPTCSRRLGYR